MQTIWFALAAVMVALYVVFDGFDFGAGALAPMVARGDRERRQILGAIGPFWDGNEVILLAAGGVLFLAFPKVLASGLSGFYLAIFLVLWTLILRGIAIEFRSHLEDGMWRSFWDVVFTGASTAAPILFGAALGNLLRGMPIDQQGWFSMPLFTDFTVSAQPGILDVYTVLVALFALAAVLHHGALFLAWKTDGPVQERSRRRAGQLFPVTVVLWLSATLATARVNPELFPAVAARPLAWLSTALFVGGLAVSFLSRRKGRDLAAFVGSAAFLLGVLAATATAVFPTMLRSTLNPAWSLTAVNASSSDHALRTGLLWWPVGLLLAAGYFTILFRLHRGKAQAAAEGEGY